MLNISFGKLGNYSYKLTLYFLFSLSQKCDVYFLDKKVSPISNSKVFTTIVVEFFDGEEGLFHRHSFLVFTKNDWHDHTQRHLKTRYFKVLRHRFC